MNIANRPKIKDRFWRLAYELDVISGENLLKRMLGAFECELGKERTAK